MCGGKLRFRDIWEVCFYTRCKKKNNVMTNIEDIRNMNDIEDVRIVENLRA